jgi:hypothetical protein
LRGFPETCGEAEQAAALYFSQDLHPQLSITSQLSVDVRDFELAGIAVLSPRRKSSWRYLKKI